VHVIGCLWHVTAGDIFVHSADWGASLLSAVYSVHCSAESTKSSQVITDCPFYIVESNLLCFMSIVCFPSSFSLTFFD